MSQTKLFLGTHDAKRRLALLDKLAEQVGFTGQRGPSRNVMIGAIADAFEISPASVANLLTDIKIVAETNNDVPDNLRSFDISKIGGEFDEPCDYMALGFEPQKCGVCGAMWWEPYRVIAKSKIENDVPDSDGNLFSVLAEVEADGKIEKHLCNCGE